MELLLNRKFKKDKYTIGELFINGEFFCHTIEDTDRGLNNNMSIDEIKSKKVYGETAIPTGTYKICMDTVSPKYSKIDFYQSLCKGKLPRLLNVKGFSGILIHPGNSAKSSLGCICVGINNIPGQVTNSRVTFTRLYGKLLEAKSKNENINIIIK